VVAPSPARGFLTIEKLYAAAQLGLAADADLASLAPPAERRYVGLTGDRESRSSQQQKNSVVMLEFLLLVFISIPLAVVLIGSYRFVANAERCSRPSARKVVLPAALDSPDFLSRPQTICGDTTS